MLTHIGIVGVIFVRKHVRWNHLLGMCLAERFLDWRIHIASRRDPSWHAVRSQDRFSTAVSEYRCRASVCDNLHFNLCVWDLFVGIRWKHVFESSFLNIGYRQNTYCATVSPISFLTCVSCEYDWSGAFRTIRVCSVLSHRWHLFFPTILSETIWPILHRIHGPRVTLAPLGKSEQP